MDKVKTLSGRICGVFQILIFVMPICAVGYWLDPEYFNSMGVSLYLPKSEFEFTYNLYSQFIGFFITLIPLAVITYLLFKLKCLFNNYTNGIVFSEENVIIYKRVGQSLFGLVASNMIAETLMSLALSFQNPIGQRFISVGLGASELSYLATGFIIILISHVMQQANLLDNEAKYTI